LTDILERIKAPSTFGHVTQVTKYRQSDTQRRRVPRSPFQGTGSQAVSGIKVPHEKPRRHRRMLGNKHMRVGW
jgi:hypothetical protein